MFDIGILGYASRRTWRRRGTALGDAGWRRVAGFRVVVSWPQSGYAPPPPTAPRSLRARVAGVAGALLILGGVAAVGVAISAQVHAPQPSQASAGAIGSSGRLSLPRSLPVSVDIPAIGVISTCSGWASTPTARFRSRRSRRARPRQRGTSTRRRRARSGRRSSKATSTAIRGLRFSSASGPCAPATRSTCGLPTVLRLFSRSPAYANTLNQISRQRPFTRRPTTRLCA